MATRAKRLFGGALTAAGVSLAASPVQAGAIWDPVGLHTLTAGVQGETLNATVSSYASYAFADSVWFDAYSAGYAPEDAVFAHAHFQENSAGVLASGAYNDISALASAIGFVTVDVDTTVYISAYGTSLNYISIMIHDVANSTDVYNMAGFGLDLVEAPVTLEAGRVYEISLSTCQDNLAFGSTLDDFGWADIDTNAPAPGGIMALGVAGLSWRRRRK